MYQELILFRKTLHDITKVNSLLAIANPTFLECESNISGAFDEKAVIVLAKHHHLIAR